MRVRHGSFERIMCRYAFLMVAMKGGMCGCAYLMVAMKVVCVCVWVRISQGSFERRIWRCALK